MALFTAIQHEKTGEAVAHQIEALILEGVLRVGDRLPGERELALETGVSRPVVREAIGRLENDGLLTSRQGGGTYVADVIGTVFSPQIGALLASHRKATVDYLEYRREIEGTAARLAAQRATAADRQMLDAIVARMQSAHEKEDFAEEAQIDIEFHSAIGEMAHNLVLLHTLRACYRLLSAGIFNNRQLLYSTPGGRAALLRQHLAIHEAIASGDGEAAEREARSHLDYVLAAARDLELREERERVSALRRESRGGDAANDISNDGADRRTNRKMAVNTMGGGAKR